MTKKLILLAAGALTALAVAALPAGATAAEMEAHCSAAPCVGVIENTGITELFDDSGLGIKCNKETGTVTLNAATTSTFSVALIYHECTDTIFGAECQNEGAGTKRIATNTLTGHFITATTGKPATAGTLLTGVNYTFTCISGNKTVTGNVIGTIENPECGLAKTHHTIQFTQSSAGQQTDKTYTGVTFDLLSNGTTASQTSTTHINWQGKTVTFTC